MLQDIFTLQEWSTLQLIFGLATALLLAKSFFNAIYAENSFKYAESKLHGAVAPKLTPSHGIFGWRDLSALFNPKQLFPITTLPSRHDMYGDTFATRYLNKEILFTSNPLNIKELLTNRHGYFDTTEMRQRGLSEINWHPFSNDRHFDMHRLVVGYIAKNIKDLSAKIDHLIIQSLADICNESFPVSKKKEIEITELSNQIVIHFINYMALGEEKELELVGNSDARPAFISHFISFFRPLLSGLGMTVFMPPYIVSLLFPSIAKKKQITRKLFLSMAGMVGLQNKDQATHSLGSTFANHFQQETITSDQLFNFYAAATQGTLGSMQIGLALLAQNQAAQDKLRRIVRSTFPSTESITEQALLQCQYLQWIINEALRLHPVVSLTTRIALRDCTLPAGGGPNHSQPVIVRKGQQIIASYTHLHRRQDVWGPDSNNFVPERWNEENSKTFLPFAYGPSTCPGSRIGRLTTSIWLVRLMQQFDSIESCMNETDSNREPKLRMGYTVTLTLKKTRLMFTHRSN
ncbi:hypothetical protein M441DRAFT_63192 [Trichoderma asperellum CBS 433.97]|uniref:Cytochrome P450 n=2 Tax=Trichoderma asperellum TaxID=101201 RepID=A0A2T3YQE0_TRIA4|nr:hypothetical protein M441DRAFT_63192 [Trichoderma asperellum CBS 433.97]PTB34788.1 hypothetical protein M441DRAFT_63192 [Trichoderma asperellum CBS 433.97]